MSVKFKSLSIMTILPIMSHLIPKQDHQLGKKNCSEGEPVGYSSGSDCINQIVGHLYTVGVFDSF